MFPILLQFFWSICDTFKDFTLARCMVCHITCVCVLFRVRAFALKVFVTIQTKVFAFETRPFFILLTGMSVLIHIENTTLTDAHIEIYAVFAPDRLFEATALAATCLAIPVIVKAETLIIIQQKFLHEELALSAVVLSPDLFVQSLVARSAKRYEVAIVILPRQTTFDVSDMMYVQVVCRSALSALEIVTLHYLQSLALPASVFP